jgi:DNA invertase Pin-like site-specific DNA recombinase
MLGITSFFGKKWILVLLRNTLASAHDEAGHTEALRQLTCERLHNDIFWQNIPLPQRGRGAVMTVFGYARCSVHDEITEVARLRAAGCSEVHCERATGANGGHRERAKLLRGLEPGDMVVVTSLTRLARSTRDLLETLHAIAERNIGFKSLGEPWADSTTPNGHMMLTILGGLAEFERELIKARIARTRARGIRLGRHRKLNNDQRRRALARLAAGETQVEIARTYNVDPSTIGRLLIGMLPV